VHGGEADLVDPDADGDGAAGGGEVGGGPEGPKAEARQRSQAGEPARRVTAELTQDI